MTSDHDTPQELSPLKRALFAVKDLRARLEAMERVKTEPIAIVGMACRFPGGAVTLDRFWQILDQGIDAIREVPPDRWDVDEYFDPDPDAPGKTYSRGGGFLDEIDGFDAGFFGISPREVVSMDPQQRLLLEVTWEALENAGIAPPSLAGSQAGVFVGIGSNDYGQFSIQHNDPTRFDAYVGTGGASSVAAGRLSYILGLHGPAIALDTACSSSLVAVDLAVQQLRAGKCDLAIAGGVNAILSPATTVYLSRLHALSPSSRCKAFDASADGYVRGEGCGIIVLKRLSAAEAHGDSILAIIRGSATNHDGRSSGLTVPNGQAQQAVIRQALIDARLEPAQVQYIEAHGTGTPLGDPIELRAINAVLGVGRGQDAPLIVGTVKTNIGHLEAAAGIAGVIKVVLAMQHGYIPPSLHFHIPSPHIRWDELPVKVATACTPWPHGEGAAFAGVSSFGFSGTNAHVIIEAAPPGLAELPATDRSVHILTASAATLPALKQLAGQYGDYVDSHAEATVADIAFSANTGRASLEYRVAVTGPSAPELQRGLRAFVAGEDLPSVTHGQAFQADRRKVTFLFAGQGAQYAGMASELYATSPSFRRTLDRCDDVLRPLLPRPLLSVLFPESGSGDEGLIDRTEYTQPALFAIEYALAELWRSWGIEPVAVLGHSVGEYVAACVAGVFSFEDGLRLIAERARLMQKLPEIGSMTAVFASEQSVSSVLDRHPGQLAIAAVNGPDHVVISGGKADVATVVAQLERMDVRTRPLTVSHAFHSPLMDPVLDEFERAVSRVNFLEPRMRLISNLSGQVASGGELSTASYWSRHLREPVKFSASVETLHQFGCECFIEIGPGATLLGMASRCLPEGAGVWLPSLRPGQGDWHQLLKSLSALYVRGVPVDWRAFDRDYVRRRHQLPTYPFQRQRYWLEMPAPVSRPTMRSAADSLYEIDWRPQENVEQGEHSPGTWLIFADATGVAPALTGHLRAAGHRCVTVLSGPRYACDNDTVAVNPESREDFDRLLSELPAGSPLQGIVHLWAVDEHAENPSADDLDRAQSRGCGSVLYLVQALAVRQEAPPQLWLVTRGAQAVDSVSSPTLVAQAPLWGLGRVVGTEYPHLRCTRVDLDPEGVEPATGDLALELRSVDREEDVAFRRGVRFVARLRRREEQSSNGGGQVTPEGTYLVTGGCGGLGLHVAEWLVREGALRVVLTGRSEPSAEALQVIARLRDTGADVNVQRGDVSSETDLRRILSSAPVEGRPLRGVVHAAGMLDDATLAEQTLARFRTVMASKVRGSWLLHQLTAADDLDFFVLFSSAAAVLGSPGQGNYAAANAFLDALAHHRRALGRAALSVNWGPWAESGMAARLGDRERQRLSAHGVESIEAAKGIALMEQLLREHAVQVAVMPFDWSKLLPSDEGMPPSLLRDVVAKTIRPGVHSTVPPDRISGGLAQRLELTPMSEWSDVMTASVRQHVAKVLALPSDSAIPEHTPLTGIGLDSLMALELRNALAAAVGRALPASLVYDCPTIDALSSHLLAMLAPAQTLAAAAPSAPTIDASVNNNGTTSIDGLSQEQIAALLEERLATLGRQLS